MQKMFFFYLGREERDKHCECDSLWFLLSMGAQLANRFPLSLFAKLNSQSRPLSVRVGSLRDVRAEMPKVTKIQSADTLVD